VTQKPACYNSGVADADPRRGYTREEVCRLLNLRESVLEEWESNGFITRMETFQFRDLVAVKTLRQLRRSRVRTERIRLILSALRERLRHVQDPLKELKVFTDGRKIAVQVDGQKMEALSGQLLLDFDQEEIRRLLAFPGQRVAETAAEADAAKKREAHKWFERGVELEQTGAPLSQVIEAYQKALEYDDTAAGALVNLGTIHYHLQQWKEAERSYLHAIESRPDYALAHFNLGNLYDETGDWPRALEHYLVALRIDPEYADAHYNVALLYQSHGEPLKAVRHWRTYLKIDGNGYWAGIARRELNKLRQDAVVQGKSGG
jgi:tetratricopeptide (TPR) repeat protein